LREAERESAGLADPRGPRAKNPPETGRATLTTISSSLTDEEVVQFKARILSDLAHHRIEIYQAPQYEMEERVSRVGRSKGAKSQKPPRNRKSNTHDNLFILGTKTQRKIPFAVVGSDKIVSTPDGRQVRGRAYPWGRDSHREQFLAPVLFVQDLVRVLLEFLHMSPDEHRSSKRSSESALLSFSSQFLELTS
jgi:septin 7